MMKHSFTTLLAGRPVAASGCYSQSTCLFPRSCTEFMYMMG